MGANFSLIQPVFSSTKFCSIACLLAALFLGVLPEKNVSAEVTILRVASGGLTSSACGDNWENACELQFALNNAHSGTEIWVKAGIYKPTTGFDRSASFNLKSDVALYGGFVGNENDRSQRDPKSNVTILSGEIGTSATSDNSINVVNSSYTNANAVLDGFTISGGSNRDIFGVGAGMANDFGSPTLTNLIFSNNSSWAGGGMYNGISSRPTLTNITFSNNKATIWGGGMGNDGVSSNPTLNNVTFANNSAGSGGGLYNEGNSTILTNVTFINNSAVGGGGMWNSGSTTILTNITFTGNSAEAGGGMYNLYLSSKPILNNVTFRGNSASYGGGGIFFAGTNPSGELEQRLGLNETFDNREIADPIITNPTVRNSILWGNTAPNGPQIGVGGVPIASPIVTYSDVQDGYPGMGNINADPLLGDLSTFGESTQVFPLLPGSTAIDAGDDATCAITDQRGVNRPQVGQCDMGAYEARIFVLTITSGGRQSALINNAFAEPLVLSVTCPYGDPVNGGSISFSPPSSGATAVLSNSQAIIMSNAASVTATANSTAGAYTVTARATGVTEPISFELSNLGFGIYLPMIFR